MNIEDFKQFDGLICDEVNIEVIKREIGKTEKGILYLMYRNEDKKYFWKTDNELHEVKNESIVEDILRDFYGK